MRATINESERSLLIFLASILLDIDIPALSRTAQGKECHLQFVAYCAIRLSQHEGLVLFEELHT